MRSILCPVLVLCALLAGPLATDAGAAETCPNQQLRSEDGWQSLPDCRAYELVSPAQKNGGQAGAAGEGAKYSIAAADGDAVVYGNGSTAAFGNTPTGLEEYSVSRRAAAGWGTGAALPGEQGRPSLASDRVGFFDPATDLSHFLFTASGQFASNPEGRLNMYLAGEDPFAGPLWITQPAIPNPEPSLGSVEEEPHPAGASSDLSTVFFTYYGTLLSADASRTPYVSSKDAWGLYGWKDGVLSSTGVLPNGEVSPFGAVPAATGHAGANSLTSDDLDNQVSADGSRVFFVSPDPRAVAEGLTSGPTELYVRDVAMRNTVQVSASQFPGHESTSGPLAVSAPDACGGECRSYVYASPDGSHALFESVDRLTSDAPEDALPKQYDFDLATEALTYLPGVAGTAPIQAGHPEADAAVVLASAADGSRFLFEQREAGTPTRLDLWSAGSTVTIAQLPQPAVTPTNSGGTLYIAPARATADGSVFLFETDSPLPGGFDNGGGFEQVYRYDATAGTLSCVSCPPTGVAPSGDARLSEDDAQNGGAGAGDLRPSRGMSADGSRVFFDSPDPLDPRDTNGRRNVYEWEDGGAHLISPAHATSPAFLLDSSESGDDVFFATAEGLLPEDTDGGYDVYDARVNGGFPVAKAPVACAGEACRPPPSPPPPVLTPPAGSATFSDPRDPIPPAPLTFGIASFTTTASGTQAGAHGSLTASFSFNQSEPGVPVQDAKDLRLELPAGLSLNPTAIPTCGVKQIQEETCPPAAAVGSVTAEVSLAGSPFTFTELLYNVTPYPGEPAAFMTAFAGTPVRFDESVPAGGGRIELSAGDLTEALAPASMSLTLWGVPEDFNGTGAQETTGGVAFGGVGAGPATPFLTNPTQCATPLTSTLSADAWSAPGAFQAVDAQSPAPTGCNRLVFEPSISVAPDVSVANEPGGYLLDLRVPQNQSPTGLATPELRDASVLLPQGVVISPSTADGLKACSEAQVGLQSSQPASCPAPSTIGTVELATPLLSAPLDGRVYLAEQSNNPFRALLAIYVVVEGDGVRIKLAGQVQADPVNGQLTIAFREMPQLPLSELRLHFSGGPRALLANRSTCGALTTTSDLTPWSAPETPDARPTSAFEVSGCSPGRFRPGFLGETTENQAGGYSPFLLTVTRTDADQELGQITVQMPPGLQAVFSHVSLCGETQAPQGACPQASEIGTVTVGAGRGPDPFYLDGRVYLTGPYRGAPFGLSIVVPVVVGPFDLGTVVVRATIHVDPSTGRLTIESDPLPTVINGIPTQLRTLSVDIDRGEFIVNPTSCEPMAVLGTITSVQGAAATVSTPFQVANCVVPPITVPGPTPAPTTSAGSLYGIKAATKTKAARCSVKPKKQKGRKKTKKPQKCLVKHAKKKAKKHRGRPKSKRARRRK